MRRVPLFLRAAVVCSSLTLLLGFVAMKAGAFREESIESSPHTNTVMMPGTKSAPVDFDARGFVTSDGKSGIEVPAEVKAAVISGEPVHAYSSKSAVPLVNPQEFPIPTSLLEKTAPPPPPPMLMPSTKRAEVFDSKFPAKPPAVAPAAPTVTFPSTKSMAPAINFTPSPPPSKVVAPQTTKGKGY